MTIQPAWLDGAASPIAHVLDKLDTAEQEAFLKAMSLLETELRAGESGHERLIGAASGERQ